MFKGLKAIKIMNRIALFSVTIAVTALALMPDNAETPAIFGWHVANHIVAFAVIGGLIKFGWPKVYWLTTLAGANAFGLTIELAQWLFTMDRTPSLFDLSMNIVGSSAGVVLAVAVVSATGFTVQSGPD
jgi:glycopeptide antibiotics resistance protein